MSRTPPDRDFDGASGLGTAVPQHRTKGDVNKVVPEGAPTGQRSNWPVANMGGLSGAEACDFAGSAACFVTGISQRVLGG